jgi:HTH-type transcriptional regulator/antitoxin HigA
MELKALFYGNKDVVSKTKTILNEYGIKFLVIEKFNQSPIDGYSFWSNNNPAIVVTMRKKLLDHFAFTVLHELGHVFDHLQPNHTEEFLDFEYPNSNIFEKEQEANQFARQCFIDDAVWQRFLIENPKFNYKNTEKQMVQLASNLKIHSSIIFGRYCFETNQFVVTTGIDRTIN